MQSEKHSRQFALFDNCSMPNSGHVVGCCCGGAYAQKMAQIIRGEEDVAAACLLQSWIAAIDMYYSMLNVSLLRVSRMAHLVSNQLEHL